MAFVMKNKTSISQTVFSINNDWNNSIPINARYIKQIIIFFLSEISSIYFQLQLLQPFWVVSQLETIISPIAFAISWKEAISTIKIALLKKTHDDSQWWKYDYVSDNI